MPREITEPVDLCLADGTLNPEAIGWTRRPLHTANLTGWGRTKRWEYWGIVTPRHIVGVVISSLDYAGVHSLYVLDRETGLELTPEAVVPLGRAALPPACGAGTAYARGKNFEITVAQQLERTSIRARAGGVALDLRIGPGG